MCPLVWLVWRMIVGGHGPTGWPGRVLVNTFASNGGAKKMVGPGRRDFIKQRERVHEQGIGRAWSTSIIRKLYDRGVSLWRHASSCCHRKIHAARDA